MKKYLMISILLASLFSASKAFAVVDYAEIITAGTSTTPNTGNTTVLARTKYQTNKFKAILMYTGVVDCRYTIGSDVTISATNGAILRSGGYLILGLGDMQGFKCCAGTTTAASYGTVAAFYQIGDADSQFIEYDELGYNE